MNLSKLCDFCLFYNQLIGLVDRVFANGPGGWGSILGHVILKTLKKWYLIPLCFTLSNIRFVLRTKWSNPGKGVVPFPTPRCSSYLKGSLLVALNYGCQLYFTYYNLHLTLKLQLVMPRGTCSRKFCSINFCNFATTDGQKCTGNFCAS